MPRDITDELTFKVQHGLWQLGIQGHFIEVSHNNQVIARDWGKGLALVPGLQNVTLQHLQQVNGVTMGFRILVHELEEPTE